MIDISRAIQHPFQDQNWPVKLGIGALVNAVPILNFAGYGYMLEHLRNTERGADVPMPEWGDNFGEKFSEGLKYFVVLVIYSLPILLLTCILTIAAGGLAALTDGSNARTGDAAAAGFGILSLALTCLVLLYALFLGYVLPAATIQYARTKDIAACLRFGEIFAIARQNTGDYLLIFLVLIGVNFVLGAITSVLAITVIGLCLVIPLALVALPYFNVLVGHLCGQYARSTPTTSTATPPLV